MFANPNRVRVHPNLDDELVTKQSHKDECDIYNILKQYQRTGIVTHIAAHQPRYEQLPDPIDYQEAMNAVLQADQAFATLPASVRESFANSPRAFLEALSDPAQEARLRDLGVLKPKPAEPPAPRPAEPPKPAE